MVDISYLPYAQRAAEIERQRKYAELLQQQAYQPTETQIVGGRAIPISPWQTVAKLAQAGLGAYMQGKATKAEAELQKQSKEEAKKYFENLLNYSQGKEVTGQTPQMAAVKGFGPKELPVLNVQDGKFSQAMRNTYATPTKAGMLAKMMEGMRSENPDIARYASAFGTALMPTETKLEIGTIDPSKFTPASIKAAMAKNDYSLLEPVAETKSANLPSSIQEYLFAQGQGFKGSLADYERMKAINVNVPSPETYGALTPVIDPTTGQATYVRPGSRGSIQKVEGYTPPPKAPTQEQVVAGTYANKIKDAEDVLGKFGAGSPFTVPSTKEQFKADIPFIGNQLVKEDTQSYKVAERAFIEAWLRKTSGAVISPSEFEQARKQYIPQPGDTNQIIEQKRQARQRVLQGMAKGAGQYYEDTSSELPPGFMSVDGAR